MPISVVSMPVRSIGSTTIVGVEVEGTGVDVDSGLVHLGGTDVNAALFVSETA